MQFSNKTYDRLKLVRLFIMAFATLYLTFGRIWTGIVELPYPEQVAASLMAINTFLDATLLDSSKKYQDRINGVDGDDEWPNV